jgi:hypothetical protein
VSGSPTLTELNLARALISAEGAKALGVGLAETRALRVLELSWCKLRAEAGSD